MCVCVCVKEGRLQELEVLYTQHKAAVKDYLVAMDAKVACNKEAQAHREKEVSTVRLQNSLHTVQSFLLHSQLQLF